jgi:hypothetical protein
MEEIETKARREVERIEKIFAGLEVVDVKAASLKEVLDSYRRDARGFVDKGKFLEALEAAFICWAYVDAGLHLGVFRVPENMRDMFTIGEGQTR